MSPCRYLCAGDLAQAVQALRDEPDARALAGGQSLIAAMKLGLSAPPLLVDLRRIPDLASIREEDGSLWLGAMATHAAIAGSALVRRGWPVLSALAAGIGDQQIRNRGTIGGSLANNDPAACWPAGVLAGNATLVTDRRRISADAFFQGLFTTALQADELLRGMLLPRPLQAAYLKEEQPASRFALVGVAVARFADGVRVAVTGLGHGVQRLADAERALNERFDPAALDGLRIDPASATGDLHASARYRAHLAAVLARRAVARALAADAAQRTHDE